MRTEYMSEFCAEESVFAELSSLALNKVAVPYPPDNVVIVRLATPQQS